MDTATITVTRTLSTSPGQAFDAWTDADRLAAWWWPHLAGTTYDVDAREGGSYRISSPLIGATVRGVYTEFDRPRRLVFSWIWEEHGGPEPNEDSVLVSFEPDGDATLVTVEHTCGSRDSALEQGWSDVLDRLVRGFETGLRPSSTSD